MTFTARLLEWYDQHGRKDLPWQQRRTAYRVWVSEIMLQQTQVKTVIPYFERFMRSFPTVKALAQASVDEVLGHWSGLGYYARARNLHRTAQLIHHEHGGRFPRTVEALSDLPGIGRSTAGAILAQAYDQRETILDGNVKRVLTRYHAIEGWPEQRSVLDQLWQLAERHTPAERACDYTQAIMDLGATLCVRGKPQCERCPVAKNCIARQRGIASELPTPKPKKALPVRQTRMLLLHDAPLVYLEKRPPAGIWGGLLSLPEAPLEVSVEQWCDERFGLRVAHVQHWPTVRHTFSHFHLDIHPVSARAQALSHKVMEASGPVWYNASGLGQQGLAAPVKRLLDELVLKMGG